MKLDDNLKTQKSQQKKSKVETSFNYQSKHLVGKLLIMFWITHGLLVGNFWGKKKLSEHINMGSSFEDLDAISPTVKTDTKSDEWSELQNFLNFQNSHLMWMTSAVLFVCCL